MNEPRRWSPGEQPEWEGEQTPQLEIEQREELEWTPGRSGAEDWRPSDHPDSPSRIGSGHDSSAGAEG